MGYYKNLEIALQVEEPDRVPAPKPASNHAAFRYWDSRTALVRYEKLVKEARRSEIVERLVLTLTVLLLGAAAVTGWIL
jgi:hypothetical protein